MYATLKLIHVAAVGLSAAGFVIRYVLATAGRVPRNTVTRIAPHLVDTVLLASALGLVWLSRLSPLENPWLEAKIVGVVVYIVAGMVAMKHGRSRATRTTALAIALVTLAWIVSVAMTKSPWGLLTGVFA
jgi:uncharacterized membrane protein SirB2